MNKKWKKLKYIFGGILIASTLYLGLDFYNFKNETLKPIEPPHFTQINSFSEIDVKSIKNVEVYQDNSISKTLVIFNKTDKELPKVFREVGLNIANAWIERILLQNNIEFKIISKFTPTNYKEPIPQTIERQPIIYKLGNILLFLLDKLLSNFLSVLSLSILIFFVWITLKGTINKNTVDLITPDRIKGSMDDLVGMADIKKEVRNIISMIQNKTKYESFGVDKPFNVMFTGPAGTGKSKLAGYFAKELGFPIITCAGSNLETGFVGGGSKTLNSIVKQAKKLKNCVIFIDEGQSLFMQRGGSGPLNGKHTDDTANTLLAILDGVNEKQDGTIVWVVASNFDDGSLSMDEAMLRRFQLKINFRHPNKAERKELFTRLLFKDENKELLSDDIDLSNIAEITAELSPAIIETIVSQAKISAIEENVKITNELLFQSFERTVIGLTDRATTGELKLTREYIAKHELGHFFMELNNELEISKDKSFSEIQESIKTLKISTEAVSKSGALGYVLSKSDENKLATKAAYKRTIKKLYGGLAAEELCYGEDNVTAGASNDIEKISSILDYLVNGIGMYSKAKINYYHLKDGNDCDTVKQLAEQLYEETKKDLVKWIPLFEELSKILLDKYVLSKDEMFEILESNETFKEILKNEYNIII